MPERAARASAERGATATRPTRERTPTDRSRERTPMDRPTDRQRAGENAPSGIPGRRTVVIRGQVVDRYAPRRGSQRSGGVTAGYYRALPDRAAKWAVLLGVLLVVVALASAHL